MSNTNSNNKSSSSGGGVGFFGLLTIVLITLKLTHMLDASWTWWWVFSPMFVGFGLLLLFTLIYGIILACTE